MLELLVLGLIFIPLEGMFALREKRVFRAGWQTDLKHFFVSHPCWCGEMRRVARSARGAAETLLRAAGALPQKNAA